MKKVIRLSESDLKKIIKLIIESDEELNDEDILESLKSFFNEKGYTSDTMEIPNENPIHVFEKEFPEWNGIIYPTIRVLPDKSIEFSAFYKHKSDKLTVNLVKGLFNKESIKIENKPDYTAFEIFTKSVYNQFLSQAENYIKEIVNEWAYQEYEQSLKRSPKLR